MKVHFHHSLQIKTSYKTVEIKVFRTMFDDGRIRILIVPDPGGPKTCGSGPLVLTLSYAEVSFVQFIKLLQHSMQIYRTKSANFSAKI